jgi:putative ABC transport system permease protein
MSFSPHFLPKPLRALLVRPSYFAIGTLVLTVSIAALLLVVSVVDGVLVRPPTARATSELGFVRSSLPFGIMSYPDFVDLRKRNTVFRGVFAYDRPNEVGVAVGDRFSVEKCAAASGNFFNLLGVSAARGRVFIDADDVKNGRAVAVISPALAARLQVDVGSILRIDQQSFEVIGVLPANFCGIDRNAQSDIWLPMSHVVAYRPSWILENRNVQWVRAAGRLNPGVSLAAANAEVFSIGSALQHDFPQTDLGLNLYVDSYFRFRLAQDSTAKIMLLVMAVVGLLFLLAFSNFCALTLLRLFNRRREIAIKLAVGARVADIGWWILGELATVLTVSLAAGFGLAVVLLRALHSVPKLQPILAGARVAIEYRSAAVVIGSCVLCGLIVWVAALKAACRVELLSAIKESASAPRRQIALTALFAVQFAIAFALLATGLAFFAGLREAASQKLPLRSENVLLTDLNMRLVGFAGQLDRVKTVVDSALARVRECPGVEVAAAASVPPLNLPNWTNLIIDGKDPALEADKNLAALVAVTPQYHEATGVRLRSGRAIDENDLTGKARVAVISASAATRFWPGTNPLGHTFRHNPNGPLYTIIGVCDDIAVAVGKKSPPQVLLPYSQVASPVFTMYIGVRSSSMAMKQQIVDALNPVWPYVQLSSIRSIDDDIKASFADLAATVQIVIWITGLALIVAAVGIYFFSAHTASQTIRDAAIRVALGSTSAGIVVVHIKRYRLAVVAGLVIGAALLALARSMLPDVSGHVVTVRVVMVSYAAAATIAVTLVGLCVPLRRLLALDLYRILVRTAE